MSGWIVSMVVGAALLLVGCGARCSLEHLVNEGAGPGAVDCGYVARDTDRSETNVCVAAALESGQAFQARYEFQGIDSRLLDGIFGSGDGQVVRLSYDANLYGGLFSSWEYIQRSLCVTPQLIDGARLAAGEFPPFECETWVHSGLACETGRVALLFASIDRSQ